MAVGDDKFELIADVVTDGGIVLKKYKSRLSGLTVCIAEAEGPLVSGYLCVATETYDNDGLPHTLEHLVFMGSEKYPYKGILDMLANRCIASGTNAWTDTDHTCYTLSTAGSEGFLQLLPIYVDHLLYPLLTDSAYITEVHHINSEGEDAGVVYSEMQAKENMGERLCHFSMLDAMYPGHCGYKSRTSGLLKNLRESTTNEKVRDYHKEFYCPENLSIIIVGQIEAEDVFRSLQPVEERILNDGRRLSFVRPWQSAISDLEESSTIDTEYPSDEELFGMVIASWRGPAAKDYSEILYLQILMEYLTDTAISPLQKNFVENKDPYCSQVDYTIIENFISCIYLHFSNVATNKLGPLKKRLLYLLERIASGTDPIDMQRMKTVIHKRKLYILSRMESNPHDQLAMCLIGDFLYGYSVEDLKQRVQQVPMVDRLFDKPEAFWRNLLKNYMVDGHYVIVLGRSSVKLMEENVAEEKERLEKQYEELGIDGLKAKDASLKQAMQQNEIPPPEAMITSVPIPSVKSIKFHPIKRYCNYKDNPGDQPEEVALLQLPCRFQLDVVKSNFVRMYVLMDTSDVPESLRMYIPLLVELIDVSPLKRDGEIVPYHEVVRELAEDTIFTTMSIGLDYSRFSCQNFAQVVCLKLMVEEENYAKGVQWIKELLYQTIFDPPRIHTVVTKMITDVSRMKRSGGKVVKSLVRNLCFASSSNHWRSSMMRQHSFLNELLKTLAKTPKEVVNSLNVLRDAVTRPEAMTIHLAANIPNLKQKTHPAEAWASHLFPNTQELTASRKPIKQCYELLKSFSDSMKGAIVGVGAIESTYLITCSPCMSSYTDPDYPALLVLNQYLSQTEGPMWQQIRGLGLSYAFALFARPSEGLICFALYQSSHLLKAYKESQKIIDAHLNNVTAWNQSLLENCCSSLVFEIIEQEKTIASVVGQSVSAYYKNVALDFTKTLIEKISRVTPSDMERVGAAYLKPLFDPELSKCAICCHPTKVEEMATAFKGLSRDLTVLSSLEDDFLKKY